MSFIVIWKTLLPPEANRPEDMLQDNIKDLQFRVYKNFNKLMSENRTKQRAQDKKIGIRLE